MRISIPLVFVLMLAVAICLSSFALVRAEEPRRATSIPSTNSTTTLTTNDLALRVKVALALATARASQQPPPGASSASTTPKNEIAPCSDACVCGCVETGTCDCPPLSNSSNRPIMVKGDTACPGGVCPVPVTLTYHAAPPPQQSIPQPAPVNYQPTYTYQQPAIYQQPAYTNGGIYGGAYVGGNCGMPAQSYGYYYANYGGGCGGGEMGFASGGGCGGAGIGQRRGLGFFRRRR